MAKIPKGTLNLDCISLLPDDKQSEFAEAYGTRARGDMDARTWADAELMELEEYRRRLDLHIMANARNSLAANQANIRGKKNLRIGTRAVLVQDRFDSGANIMSLEARAVSVRGKLGTILSDMMDKYRPLHLGFQRDREGVRNVVREIFGTSTGDQEAGGYAQAWAAMAEYTRKRLNAAGSQIPKIKGWGMPQYNDAGKVGSVSRDEWVNSLTNKLDWIRMSDETGLSSTELQVLLRDQIYDSIITEGASKIDLGRISGRPQGKGLLNRLKEHRFLHFKDGDSWLDYQDQFGTDDYLTAMDTFAQTQALNIAAMETLGPNPDIGFQHLVNMLRKSPIKRDKESVKTLEHLYDNVLGRVGTVSTGVASTMSGIRSANVFMHLGNATLSMITDPAFLAMTARINDVPIFKTLMRQIKLAGQLGAGGSKDLRFAAQLGFVGEYASDRLLAAARYTDVAPQKFMARLSEISMRASWMHSITVAGRAAFNLEYSAQLARESSNTWAQLSKKRRSGFERFGINEKDWDVMRNSSKVYHDGVPYMDINSVGTGTGKETATKMGAMIQSETNYAVPTPTAETRAFINRGLPRGEAGGELFRTLGEFKSFPITLVMLHARRAMHTNAMNRAAYGGSLVALLLGMGYLSTASKDVSKGRDIVPLINDDGEFNFKQAGRIATQAGALGIYGDLIFQDQTRFGASGVKTLAGPTPGLAMDAIALAQQSAMTLYEQLAGDGDKELDKLKSRIGYTAKTYKPDLWYFRALEDRAVNKGINWLTDGDWDRKLRRAERTRRKDLGQTQFWAEDEWLPDAAPALSNP